MINDRNILYALFIKKLHKKHLTCEITSSCLRTPLLTVGRKSNLFLNDLPALRFSFNLKMARYLRQQSNICNTFFIVVYKIKRAIYINKCYLITDTLLVFGCFYANWSILLEKAFIF